jgi:hypothetical protein
MKRTEVMTVTDSNIKAQCRTGTGRVKGNTGHFITGQGIRVKHSAGQERTVLRMVKNSIYRKAECRTVKGSVQDSTGN